MEKIYKLNINDIKKIISEKYSVSIDDVKVIDCGYDNGDGPYPGTGHYAHIEVKIPENNKMHGEILPDYVINEFDKFEKDLPYLKVHLNNPCTNCTNHPMNGGSGICHCILGSPSMWAKENLCVTTTSTDETITT